MLAVDHQRSLHLDTFPNDRAQIDGLLVQDQLARFDPSDVEQIIDESLHELRLPVDDIHRASGRIRRDDPLFQHCSGADDGAQRIAQFVTQGDHEFVLAVAVLAGLFASLPELPRGRSVFGQQLHDARILTIEPPLGTVTHDPDGPHRFAVRVEGKQECFDEAGLRQQRREAAVWQFHQLDSVAVDDHATGTGIARHRAIARVSEHTGHGLPAKDVAFEETDAGGVGVAQVDGDLHEALQHVARIDGHLLGQRGECLILRFVVRRSDRPRVQLAQDVNLRERSRCSAIRDDPSWGIRLQSHLRTTAGLQPIDPLLPRQADRCSGPELVSIKSVRSRRCVGCGGIGGRLMEVFEQWARERGCVLVAVATSGAVVFLPTAWLQFEAATSSAISRSADSKRPATSASANQ